MKQHMREAVTVSRSPVCVVLQDEAGQVVVLADRLDDLGAGADVDVVPALDLLDR